jgi:uncharacterized protein with GYD domain
MPIFITQGRYSQQAIKGMADNPEDRAEPVRQLFERAGGRVLNYYMTFGEHDFLIVSEVPDEKTMLSILAVAGYGGGVTDLKTSLAMTTAQAKEAFAAAKGAVGQFRSAGQAAS